MPKRTSTEANSHSPTGGPFPLEPQESSNPSPSRAIKVFKYSASPGGSHSADGSPRDATLRREDARLSRKRAGTGKTSQVKEAQELPGITRKVKACAACRKQKIRCLMDDDTPPCRRCKERSLSCRLNKSLQTLMHEDSKWKSSVSLDITNIHASLRDVLQSLSLPPLPPPRTSAEEPNFFFDHDDLSHQAEEQDQSYDNSPKVSPMTDSLAHVPIESLYQITGLRSLRSQDTGGHLEEQKPSGPLAPDFIARGALSLEDAEHLVAFYLTRLDPYIYGLGAKYKDLESFRRSSAVLTACICTVSALHETTKPHLYGVCNREFRRLVSGSMFERRIDLEYLRALCIGSYWLSDISWTLSGYAIRRASELHLHRHYYRAAGALREHLNGPSGPGPDLQDSVDGVRVLYLLYICDQHLSILYGRPPIIREQDYIQGWESYLASPLTTNSDQRIASQVALLLIMSQVRDFFGPDKGQVIPNAFVSQLTNFNRQLDQWLGRWSASLKPNGHIGNFPSKGVLLHYHFAKLHVCSYVFRGLVNMPIPAHFLEIAFAAVTAATSILELLLEDDDLRSSLAGVPHYFHTMIAFACVFLLKVATTHSDQLLVNLDNVFALTARVAKQFRATSAGKWHLVHRMADGLEKMAETLKRKDAPNVQNFHPGVNGNTAGEMVNTQLGGQAPYEGQPAGNHVGHVFVNPSQPGMSMGLGIEETDLGMGMPFFDFEGSALDLNNGGFGFL